VTIEIKKKKGGKFSPITSKSFAGEGSSHQKDFPRHLIKNGKGRNTPKLWGLQLAV
jgi:hypothetical protein